MSRLPKEIGDPMKNSLFFLSVLTVACSSAAIAADYPSRPIRIIVPYGPGGTTDLVARHISEPLARALGQPVIVENKAGAGGVVGTAELARANADGYTLGIGTVSTMVIAPASGSPQVSYSAKDFTPITNVAATPNIIAVTSKFPAKDLAGLIVLIKANPEKYAYASSGIGSINHMMGESFQAGAGLKIRHVPYRGSGPAIQDVIAGNVDILVDQLPSSKTFIDSGRIRLLGAISPKRLAEYPNVPTMEEAGIAGFNDQAWYGLIGPAKLPQDVQDRLAKAMQTVMTTATVRSNLEGSGASPLGSSSAAFTAQINQEVERMRKLIADRNIKLD